MFHTLLPQCIASDRLTCTLCRFHQQNSTLFTRPKLSMKLCHMQTGSLFCQRSEDAVSVDAVHVTIGCVGAQLSRAAAAQNRDGVRAFSQTEGYLHLSPVTPPVPLLHKDSPVMDFRLLPQQDLLELRPLEGAVRQLPSLVLKAHAAALITTVRTQHHTHENTTHNNATLWRVATYCLSYSKLWDLPLYC